jgi:hypothetical protein
VSGETLSEARGEAEALWASLTEAEQEKFALKLSPDAARGDDVEEWVRQARAACAALTVVDGDARETADRFLTLRCFVAQASADRAVWGQLHRILVVRRSFLEFTVRDRDRFLSALRAAGYAVNSWMEKIARRFSKYHRFDNARALTDYRFDPQLHFCNDRADEEGYGPAYFSAHWDAQSVYARRSSLLSRIPAALSHAKHPATPEQVREYLRRLALWPVAEPAGPSTMAAVRE